MAIQSILVLLSLFLLLPSEAVAASVGICYGRVANNLPPIFDVINILKSNNVSDVRIFDADPTTLQAFSGTGIKFMIGVPNEMLDAIAQGTPFFALQWLQTNILSHIFPNQVKYIAVGNEVFLKDPYYAPYVVPAIVNLYQALQHLNLHESIKLSSPQAASILSISYPPSSGTFNPSLRSNLLPLLRFLYDTQSPFMVNVYPYFSYTSSMEHVSLDYALFRAEKTVQDGRLMYGNLFEASVDAFLYAIEKEGFGEMEVVVSETGWPKGGGVAASVENALAYNENVVRRAVSNVGTPKRPGEGLEVYLFDLFDENEKSGNECEKHFGIFGPDGIKAYDLRFN
ncbi:Glycoside hydrolase, family 17 [Corchorus capsularis]|uniref:glucan endo-1,3-beta-D-glucosidase n=1 Tax=Corchorus capsularis TaxID=210143 RepID=A0A1R3I6M0_COCAP|nr:Glycoside hydrolase, family 17 [Corchorus capsularis]